MTHSAMISRTLLFIFFSGVADDVIPFVRFTDDIGTVGQTETRKVFKTADAYQSYFGHKPPSEVDFASDWVVFYSAGREITGGRSVSITRITTSASGQSLKVTTSLSKPGADCIVLKGMTKPYVLAKFRRPVPAPQYVQFYSDDETRPCSGDLQIR